MIVLIVIDDHVVAHRISWRQRLHALLWNHRLVRELASGTSSDSSVMHSLCAQRLVSPRHRSTLARSLEHQATGGVEPPLLAPARAHLAARTTAATLRRQCAPELLELADRLRATAPLDPRGVALAHLLVTDGVTPLRTPAQRQELLRAARTARAAL